LFRRRLALGALAGSVLGLVSTPWASGPAPAVAAHGDAAAQPELFATSDQCMACHNGLTAPGGEDVSIGVAWRASIMANSARDPYFQAAVRREILDHPSAAAEIEDECAACHMPMARTASRGAGRPGEVFAHLPVAGAEGASARLAADGVSCTLCHQVTAEKLGTPESFNGGYVIDGQTPFEQRRVYGPYPVASGPQRVMHSASGFQPQEGAHVRDSALCATCHTLHTRARGPAGEVIGELPEQAVYQEWQHSAFANQQSCQSCHMPAVRETLAIASVGSAPRPGLARHGFIGGNFFMLQMLKRYRDELGVIALPEELDASARRTLQLLQESTAQLAIERARIAAGRIELDVAIENRSGHKLPTGYPSRRVWLHVTARDGGGALVFESGALAPSGAIQGNAGDEGQLEPHYEQITRADQVQIYESVMGDAAGAPTTGLLRAVRYLKDNRLLPRGFDKGTAHADVAVRGEALADADFGGGEDRIRYTVPIAGRAGPFRVEVELLYQPIGFRWAHNLQPYAADETRRFVSYYEAMAQDGATALARAVVELH
jgi:hypothetical protein